MLNEIWPSYTPFCEVKTAERRFCTCDADKICSVHIINRNAFFIMDDCADDNNDVEKMNKLN